MEEDAKLITLTIILVLVLSVLIAASVRGFPATQPGQTVHIRNEITGDHNIISGGSFVGRDQITRPETRSAAVPNSGGGQINITHKYSPGGEKKRDQEETLETVMKEYKKFVTEDQNSTLRMKIEQLKLDGKMCFIERKFRKENIGGSLTTSELLDTLPRSKTTLVSAPLGTGKSTLAASITEKWAKSDKSIN